MLMKDNNHVKQQNKTILQGVIKLSLRGEDVSCSVTNPFNLKVKLYSFFSVLRKTYTFDTIITQFILKQAEIDYP